MNELYWIATNDSFDLSIRYEAAKQMHELRNRLPQNHTAAYDKEAEAFILKYSVAQAASVLQRTPKAIRDKKKRIKQGRKVG